MFLELSSHETCVFFGWLRPFNQTEPKAFEDQAEQRVLWGIEAMLESTLVGPLDAKYDELRAAARARVGDSEA